MRKCDGGISLISLIITIVVIIILAAFYSGVDNETIVSSNTEQSYVEYTCTTSGTYTFTLITDSGEVKADIYVEVSELDYEKMFITDGNGTVLGLKSEYYSEAESCHYISRVSTIEIPEKIGKETITVIGENAFGHIGGIETIVLPDTVTTIGNHAFDACDSLKNINIPDGVISIGNSAFLFCIGLTTLELPDSVVSMGNYVFNNCGKLTTITLESGSTLTVPTNKWGATNATVVQE